MASHLISPKPVLLVDDSTDDALLMRRAFTRAGLQNPLIHFLDGESAIAYLTRAANKEDSCPSPVLILLDIKMPRMDGFEVLKWVKSRPDLADVPAVMLTSSSLSKDIKRAETLGANSFLTKPPTFTDLIALVERIKTRWMLVK